MSDEDRVLQIVKRKCPKMLRFFLPPDEKLREMIRQIAVVKGKELK